MTHSVFMRKRILCPGPTPIPAHIQLIPLISEQIHHREKSFAQVFKRCQKLLAEILQSQTDPVLLTGSGTSAMEAVCARLIQKDDAVLVLNGGKFGERWTEILTQLGAKVQEYPIPWGYGPDLKKLAELLQEKKYKAVFFQANETSTAVSFPVEKIAQTIQQNSDALIIVDCISSLLAEPLLFDSWKLDAVVGASQKGFSLPAGLAFACLSQRAWNSPNPNQRFYLDLDRERKEQEKGYTAWTPAIELVQMFAHVLQTIKETGLEVFYAHHKILAHAVRTSIKGLGLSLFAKEYFSNALTSVYCPTSITSSQLTSAIEKDSKVIFAKGQGDYQEKIFRISHMGFIDPYDIMSAIAALELSLKRLGFIDQVGVGVSTFLQHTN